MDIRDAVEADAEAMAALANQPEDVMRNLVHDRTVRVAVDDSVADTAADPAAETANDSAADTAPDSGAVDSESERPETRLAAEALQGVVSFDAREEAVHITQLAGEPATVEELLDEPLRFARREGMPVEALVEADASERRGAVERAGFTEQGPGPMFDGERTVRYRADVESNT